METDSDFFSGSDDDIGVLLMAESARQPATQHVGYMNVMENKTQAFLSKFNKMFNVISETRRTNIIRYYKLWMLYVISWLGNVFLYIQLAKIIRTKDSSSMSLPAYFVLLISSSSWFTYGFLLRDIPLVISGFIQLIGVILLLINIPKYR